MIHPTVDFALDRWETDLDADLAVLEQVRAAVERITPDDDDKLRALREFLTRREASADKLLISSEAEATIEYLYAQLNPGGANPSIERLSGANRDQLQAIVKRFAPSSNLRERERMPGPPVRVLLATDVISEGQNLQDCNRVLNYDLHWNPVRLIQRFGRVDRIGTTHDEIFLHNTWPDTDVDAELSLTERLKRRIQAFHDFIGLDTRLLSESERLNPAAMYRIYEERRLPDSDDVLDEVASHQRGISLLQQLQRDDPELWNTVTNLPDGIRSALPVSRPTAETEAIIDFQRAFEDVDVQLPLGSPRLEVGVRTPSTSRAPARPSSSSSTATARPPTSSLPSSSHARSRRASSSRPSSATPTRRRPSYPPIPTAA